MAAFPANLEAAVAMTASQDDNRVGATDRPKHAGLFQPGADDRSTVGFDHTRAYEQMPAAERFLTAFPLSRCDFLHTFCASADERKMTIWNCPLRRLQTPATACYLNEAHWPANVFA